MKKVITILLCLLLALSVCACGSTPAPAGAGDESSPTATEPTSEPTPELTPEPTSEPTPEPTPEPEPLSPYNWLGYPEIPQCDYLDLVCSQHYYREYSTYIELGGDAMSAPSVEAIDDRNTYSSSNNGSRSYYVDGQRYSVNDNSKAYMYDDWTELYAVTPTAEEKAASNINPGKVFQGTGKGSIPVYAAVDPAEYEYYEYLVSDSSDMTVTERVYLRDGNVFAIYTGVKQGDQLSETVEVTTLITGDIPEGIFELPDLSGYTEK